MVGLGRFELPTSRLSGGRSNQLSYRPALPSACPAEKSALSEARSTVSENGITRGDDRSDRSETPRLNELPGEPGIHASLGCPKEPDVDVDRLLAILAQGRRVAAEAE